MQRRTLVRGIAAIVTLAGAFAGRSVAADIQVGGSFEVKANSIWFEDAPKLARWQMLKTGGNAKALKAYQQKALSERDAWQFINPLRVKILSYERAKHQVKVEMTTPGRLLGSTWFLDDSALEQ